MPDETEWINVKMAEINEIFNWLKGFLIDDDEDDDGFKKIDGGNDFDEN